MWWTRFLTNNNIEIVELMKPLILIIDHTLLQNLKPGHLPQKLARKSIDI